MYELGPSYVQRCLRMQEPKSFWKLVKVLQPKIEYLRIQQCRQYYFRDRRRYRRYRRRQYNRRRPIKKTAPNGKIKTSVHVAVALRYMSGGYPKDIQIAFGISHAEVFNSLWLVVDAINATPSFDIVYPSEYAAQRQIASRFKAISEANFHNCAGCIDGLLIWILKPSDKETDKQKFPATKFYCTRKHKFGLNMQGVCDARKRFLNVTIEHPGLTSDYLAFISSRFAKMIETEGFLAPGLCLFGDSTYANRETMAIPFRAVGSSPKDAYNYYHSQVRINIECAFGILVQRFGLL